MTPDEHLKFLQAQINYLSMALVIAVVFLTLFGLGVLVVALG